MDQLAAHVTRAIMHCWVAVLLNQRADAIAVPRRRKLFIHGRVALQQQLGEPPASRRVGCELSLRLRAGQGAVPEGCEEVCEEGCGRRGEPNEKGMASQMRKGHWNSAGNQAVGGG